VDFLPINYVPPRLQIFWAAVVIFQIVGVLPHVIAHDGEQSLGNWIVLVGGGNDLHLAAGLGRQPYPTAAKLLGARVIELGLKIFEAAKSLVDGGMFQSVFTS